METGSSRKFTIGVVLLGLIILIASVVLTYITLSQVLTKANTVNNNNVINNDIENPINNEVENDIVSKPPVKQESEVDVYFFNQTKFDNAESDIYSKVIRLTERIDIATFAVEQIIEGPTPGEANQNPGIYRSFRLENVQDEAHLARLEGESDCAGDDFEITSLEGKIATLRFCRKIVTLSDFASGIIFEQIRKTLTQFSTIEKVRVLRQDETCFNDATEQSFDECVR